MDITTVCQKIYDISLPFAHAAKAPVASVNIAVADNCTFSDEELWEGFNKVRWDTELSSAELQIERKEGDYGIKVTSLELFEEEDREDSVLLIEDGLVF